MNPTLEYLVPEEGESFFAKAFDLPYFNSPLHFHPEFELVLITNSKGKRYIGNKISDFQEGDLTFMGADLPHLFKNHRLTMNILQICGFGLLLFNFKKML